MEMMTQLPAALQALLTTTAEQIGGQCQLIKRQRLFNASTLLATFVFGFLQHPKPTGEQLALVARQLGVPVSPQAIEQRISTALAESLHKLYLAAVQYVIQSETRVTPLLAKFTAVLVGDGTTIQLCDPLAKQFPGCGGTQGASRAALKLQLIWDMLSGRWWRMLIEPGKQSDAKSAIMNDTPPAGSLSLLDLGYFSLERMERWQSADAHWISRGFLDLLTWTDKRSQPLWQWLAQQPAGRIDVECEVGASRMRCRLCACRVPPEVAARRRQKAREKAAKKGRQPTARHLANCAWTVYLTTCPQSMLSWEEVVVLYRVRWQIELLFKLWKSQGLLAEHRTDQPVRQLVEFYARLIGVILQHWLVLVTCWSDARISLTKVTNLLRAQVPCLLAVLSDSQRLGVWVLELRELLKGLCRITKRKSDPSSPQLLLTPKLLTYCA